MLILIGCCQLVYSTLAVTAAFGMRLLSDVINFGRTLSSMAPDTSGDPMIFSAMTIALLGLGLAMFALTAGILVLRNHQIAFYFVGLFVVFSFLLACCHLVLSWYGFAAIYAMLGSSFTILSIGRWKLHRSQAFSGSSEENKGLMDEMVD